MKARNRRIAIVVGVISLAGGVVVLRDATTEASANPAVSSLLGLLLVGVMGLLAYRAWSDPRPIERPDVETAWSPPTPGMDFDRALAQFDGSGEGYLPDRARIHDRLRELAVRVYEHSRSTTREAAATAIDAGEWPADPAVADFLTDGGTGHARSWLDRIPLVGSGGPSAFQSLVSRTVDVFTAEFDRNTGNEATEIFRGNGTDPGDYSTARPTAGGRTANNNGTGVVGETIERTRWRPLVPLGLAVVGVGFLVRNAALVLAGAAPLGLATLAYAVPSPTARLSVERSIDPSQPDPGDHVEVETTVHNDGNRTIPDLRFVDGVPPGLAVVDGSPRLGTTLRPGDSATVSYTVDASRGVHEFGPVVATVRDHAGRVVQTQRHTPEDDTTSSIVCHTELGSLRGTVPLYEHAGESLGRIPTEGGDGIAFYATREYQAGDPTTRIDWKRLARSPDDELTTVEYHEEHGATVAIVVDAFPSAYRAPTPDEPSALERSLDAAGQLYTSLIASGDRVGIVGHAPTPIWLPPGTGDDHHERARQLLSTGTAFPPTPPAEDALSPHWVREFHRRFPSETQVLLLSPLCDGRYQFLIHRFRAYGHPVTVVSPDPTTDGTVGDRIVRLERRVRIEALRESGVRVVEWDRETDLAVAMETAARRWSA